MKPHTCQSTELCRIKLQVIIIINYYQFLHSFVADVLPKKRVFLPNFFSFSLGSFSPTNIWGYQVTVISLSKPLDYFMQVWVIHSWISDSLSRHYHIISDPEHSCCFHIHYLVYHNGTIPTEGLFLIAVISFQTTHLSFIFKSSTNLVFQGIWRTEVSPSPLACMSCKPLYTKVASKPFVKKMCNLF